MRIGLMGHGFVGKAIANAHTRDEMVIRDPVLGDNSASLEDLATCVGIYVAVPSPMKESGECDTSFLEGALRELADAGITLVPVISKCTVPPSVYIKLIEQYPNLVYSPEFLTAANNLQDYLDSKFWIIGGNRPWVEQAGEIIVSGVDAPLHYTDIQTASMYKYIMNSFMATKVTFMNDMWQLSLLYGISWDEMVYFMKMDPRMGHSHLSVPGPDGKLGWGGACFPKDVAAIVHEANSMGVYFPLLDQVFKINQVHRGEALPSGEALPNTGK